MEYYFSTHILCHSSPITWESVNCSSVNINALAYNFATPELDSKGSSFFQLN